MTVLSRSYGVLLEVLMALAALLVLIMTLMIGADVVLRNLGVAASPGATRSPSTSSTS